MTTPGATEAVTPEQIVHALFYEGVPSIEALALIRSAIREAEANALRRAINYHADEIARLDEVDSHKPGLTDFGRDHRAMHKTSLEAIRSLLPKEAGK